MAAKKKATKKKATKSAKKVPKKKEVVLVLSKAKEALKAHDVNVAGDALESLNDLVHNYIDQAAMQLLMVVRLFVVTTFGKSIEQDTEGAVGTV